MAKEVPGLCESCQHHGKGNNFLLSSIKKNYLKCVKTCISTGTCDHCLSSGSALYFALKDGHDDCVELLLKAGAEINAVLWLVAKIGSERYVNLFLQAGAKPDEMLNDAAQNGRVKIVDLLIKAGAKMDLQP